MRKNQISNAMVSSYPSHSKAMKELTKVTPLREFLSKNYSLFPTIYFSNNTSAAFIHLLSHLYIQEKEKTLVYSDIEHPCIIDAIRKTWNGKKKMVRLHHLMMAGRIEELESKIASITIGTGSIFVISHVLWMNGLIINVHKISKEIKRKAPRSIIIIDGAQAIGNINVKLKKNDPIDFYLGCLHKWIGCKTIVGFAAINQNWIRGKKEHIIPFLLTDRFSTFAGDIPSVRPSDLTQSTHDICSLWNIVKYVSGKKTIHAKPILKQRLALPQVVTSENRNSVFRGYYGKKATLYAFCIENELDPQNIIDDPFLKNGSSWLRI